ncbi:hypothetical protein [uncultured Gelidibacter sp.]|uniref:hypothetical protein n=1 Tax=uncultured Gelidibacter sp. TaxID=259318 RepID=UPI00261F7F64|nr:hypothetical protein [uncultured Gelidibacter sp.]
MSPEFRLADLIVGNSIDSDHFPLYVELTYEPDRAKEQLPKPVTKEQLEKAKEQLEKLKEKNASNNNPS